MNEPAEPVIVNHRCSVHGQTMQAPKTFQVTCGKYGRVCVPDAEAA